MDLDETLREAVRKDSVRVPPYPSTSMKLQQVMATPDYATADLVAAMRTDAVFTGNLLRLGAVQGVDGAHTESTCVLTGLSIATSRIKMDCRHWRCNRRRCNRMRKEQQQTKDESLTHTKRVWLSS